MIMTDRLEHVADTYFVSKIINEKYRSIKIIVYRPLIRTQGEYTPSAGLESWRKPARRI